MNYFSISTKYVSGLKLRSSDLVENYFTNVAVLLIIEEIFGNVEQRKERDSKIEWGKVYTNCLILAYAVNFRMLILNFYFLIHMENELSEVL